MVVNSLVEGIACFPLMTGFRGCPPLTRQNAVKMPKDSKSRISLNR